jgi:predicted transcriptional regulator
MKWDRELLEAIRRTSQQSLAELAERTDRKKPNLSRTSFGVATADRIARDRAPEGRR